MTLQEIEEPVNSADDLGQNYFVVFMIIRVDMGGTNHDKVLTQ